ncbi:MAG: NADH-dependent phenylglyoxylate dehydrogenase subunit epsilon [Candidatus Zixiibacteriota bacterium]
MQTKYLIIGSSHAGLNAADEIRVHDPEGPITMISMEDCPPYSPTILPYILAGKVEEKNVFLREEKDFQDQKVTFLPGKKAVYVDTKASKVSLDDGGEISYEKLLIGTGSEPTLPPVPGVKDAQYHVFRTMEDTHKLMEAAKTAKSAVILGTGLVGMHAAESLAEKGLKVEAIRGRRPAVLPNYFDKEASKLIHKVFLEKGVRCDLKNQVAQVESMNGKSKVTLKDGTALETDLLVVGTGVRSRMDFLDNTGIEMDQGILVDNMMRTSVENIWAAGDVVQAKDFFADEKILNAILPDAFEQGKIAGLGMAGDEETIRAYDELGGYFSLGYKGSVSMNTFNFYGNRSFAIGLSLVEDESDYEIDRTILTSSRVYQKLVFEGDFLVGAIGINVSLDPGIIMNVIRRRVLLRENKADFAVNPLNVSRRLMWEYWRGAYKRGK